MNSSLHIHILVNILINIYFKSSRCLLFITDDDHKIEYANYNIPIVNIKILNNFLNYSLIFRNYGCQDIFIYHENNSLIFNQFEEAILYNITKERYCNRRFVIVSSRTNDFVNILKLPAIEFVKDILYIKLESYIKSVELIFSNSKEIFEFYTHSFNGNNFREVVYLDKWFSENCSFGENVYLFPDKIKNQRGRIFRLATVPYQPNSVINGDSYEGTELGPMVDYSKKYNFTPVYLVTEPNDFGQIYENGSSDGLTKLIIEGQSDVGFGSIGRWIDYYSYSEFSKPMIRSGVTCIVPVPLLLGGWKLPLYSFSEELWLAMIVTLIVCSLVLYWFTLLYNKKKNLSKLQLFYSSWTNVIGMNLLQPIKVPNDNKVKFFCAFILFAVSSITSAYSSGLFSFMTVPRLMKTVDSVQDMADVDLKWAGGTEAWITTIYYYQEPKYRKIISNFIVDSDDPLRNMSHTYEYGFVMERLPYGHYGLQKYITKEVIRKYRIMKEDIYWDYWIIMHRKNSVLLESIDFFILRSFQAGLTEHRETKVVLDHLDTTVQRAIYFNKYHNDQKIERLNWSHVQGAFAILVIGYIFGCLVFSFEYLYFKLHKKL